MKMCMWFGYNPFFFLTFSALWMSSFWYEMRSKCIESGCLVGATPLSFPPIILQLCRYFQHAMKMCTRFWYNTLIFFLTFSALWISFFLFVKCIDSGYLVGATLLVFLNCAYVFCMEWCACGWGIILYFFSFFFCFVNFPFFWHEMLSKCIDSRYLVGTTPLTVFLQL